MNLIVTALKHNLGLFGWHETLRRDATSDFQVPAAEVGICAIPEGRHNHMHAGHIESL